MRIEGELLSQIQAAYFKRENSFLRLAATEAVAREADAAWQRIGRVVENKYGIKVGKTHFVDIETGEINQLTTVEAPPQPPAQAPAPPQPGKPKLRNKPQPPRGQL